MLTATQIRSEPHVSVSQLNLWLQCPKRYEFQYVDKLPWPAVPSNLVLGSAVHAAVASYHQAALEGREVSLADLVDVFSSACADERKPIEFKAGETAETLAHLGERLLATYVTSVTLSEVLGVEEPFRVHLADGLPPLVGFIDLIERRGGRTVIVELKTAAQRYSAQRVRDDLQLSAYALAALEMDLPGVQGASDVDLEFRVLLKAKQASLDLRPAQRQQGQLDEFRETALAIQRVVTAGVFPRNRGWQCAGCPFRQACSA